MYRINPHRANESYRSATATSGSDSLMKATVVHATATSGSDLGVWPASSQ